MRIELESIKCAIELAMTNEVDFDETLPAEIIEKLADLHSALVKLEE